MPILDPSLQCFLVKNTTKTDDKDGYAFFLRYLKISSRNISRSSRCIEASILFKKDFKESISIINEEFCCHFTSTTHLNDRFNLDCYKYFYKHIKHPAKEIESNKIRGRYKICDDKFQTRFFQPCVFYSKYHSWFLSDTPIAILSIDSSTFSELLKEKKENIEKLIKLEIDLISASGLTLVLCINYTPIMKDFLQRIIYDKQFSEIHCNFFNDDFLRPFLKDIEIKDDEQIGYFYIYCHFTEKNSEEWNLMKIFKKKAHVTFVTFSTSPDKALIQHKFKPIRPFNHCKTGFNCEYLRIIVNFVPLYDSETKRKAFIPSYVSNLCLGYINPSNFLRTSHDRILILIDDKKNQNHHIFKYINYEDIHTIKSQLSVVDPLSLTKMDEKEIFQINKIKDKVGSKIDIEKEFHKKLFFNLLNTNNFEKCLEYVAYAYSHFIRSSISDFAIHRSQIYAALEACRTCFSVVKDKNGKNSRGVIYQVDTGEGKSCIICLIAAVLALKKYTVHIASSNIKLSNRDYYNSFEFFKLLDLKSSVLLHKNELPYTTDKSVNEEGEFEEQSQRQLPLKKLSRYTNDNFFKSNADFYFETNTLKNEEIFRKSYPDEFFGDNLFNNSSRMNFSVCGIDNDNIISQNKANVIFSTFVNFECFFLHLMELCPAYIDKYFKKCSLLIDEADSFLIDEITNGTVISREIKSNAKEILTFVYQQKLDNKSAESTFLELKKNPMCSDMKQSDVEQMYKEIELVNSPEYSNGTKYSIESFSVRNNHRIRNLLRKTIKTIMNLEDSVTEFIESKLFKNNNEEEDEEEDMEFSIIKSKKFRQIIPFDYDHKGILEPNKEFSGFIQQFISLKESMKNTKNDIIFKDISMSYLYISHPIFAKLYSKICGFTGTIGNATDKKIYQDYYELITKKVPRNKANLRVTFPMILCKTIAERNSKIVKEVIEFHNRDIPVLVIFQDLKEIEEIKEKLFESGIKYINVFDGKEEYVSPEQIAGLKGSISLGTNVCGRGTDIRNQGYALHVIVSFYSSNVRVMNQAYGRTARQGNEGTCHCICLESQRLSKQGAFNIERMKKSVDEFEIKISSQQNFIKKYKKERPWIFEFNADKQTISRHYITELRRTRINVNRIVSYKYKFPICMSIDTFLKIQSQKIFSLFNCPNSKYTWRLFQRHVREMILESWSLMIYKFDIKYSKKVGIDEYKNKLNKRIGRLNKKLVKYLPEKHLSIVSTFMHIFRRVRHKYQKIILGSYKKLDKAYLSFGETRYTLFQLGFKPYSLLSRSGARIEYSNVSDTNFIEDPELNYQRKMPDNSFSFVSITERIDMIFNLIFQKISSILGEKVYLKFFLRRTLAGCEFGVCFDINLINSNEKINKMKYCLIDKDPLLVFTIFLWSMAPIMAGILIFVLVYVTGLCSKISSWIGAFPEKISAEVLKQGVIKSINLIVPKVADFFLDKIIGYLENVLDKQVEKLSEKEQIIVKELKRLFLSREFEKSSEYISNKISSFLDCFIKIPEKIGNIIKDSINVDLLMKIGLLILLCLGSYMRNFMNRKDSIKHAATNADVYDSSFDNVQTVQSTETLNDITTVNKPVLVSPINPSILSPTKQLDKIIEAEIIDDEFSDVPPIEEEEKNIFEQSFDEKSKTYEYKLNTLNLFKYRVKSNEMEPIIKASAIYKNYDLKFSKHVRTKIEYLQLGIKNREINFVELVRLHVSNIHPAISHFLGYYSKNNSLLIENKKRGFLKDYLETKNINYKLNPTDKLIVAYGIASALEFLHDHKIILRDFKPENILLDSNFYPYLYDFFMADDITNPNARKLEETVPTLMAPEHINDYEKYSLTFPIDVYAYAVNLFRIIFENVNFNEVANKFARFEMTLNRQRFEFPDSAPSPWKNLIERCWDHDPNKRPTFTEICDILESDVFVNSSINIVAFNDYKQIIKPFRPLQELIVDDISKK